MKILRKISIYISFVALFFMNSTKVFAGTAVNATPNNAY